MLMEIGGSEFSSRAHKHVVSGDSPCRSVGVNVHPLLRNHAIAALGRVDLQRPLLTVKHVNTSVGVNLRTAVSVEVWGASHVHIVACHLAYKQIFLAYASPVLALNTGPTDRNSNA